MVRRLKNPFVLAAIFCAVLVYSGIIPTRQNKFRCIFREADITAVFGDVISSPQKNGSRYAFDIAPTQILSKNGSLSSCSGILRVFMPSQQIEAFFPGKLYSAAKGDSFFCEVGAKVELSGNFSNGFFYADSGKFVRWKSGAHKIRALCRLQFKRLMYAWGRAGGLILSLLSGSREYTETSVSDGFKNAGLSHILALSGMHLSLVSSVVIFFGIKSSGRRSAFVAQIFAIAIFVWFAGMSPSLFRAMICALFLLAAKMTGSRTPDTLVTLCVAFIFHAVIRPADLKSAAFMLSYGALFGILLLSERMSDFLSIIFPRKISDAISASCGAQFFTAPISLALFRTFAPVGIIASVAASPLVTVFVYFGAACIFLCLICPALVSPAGFLLNFLYNIIKAVVLFFAQFPIITIC